METAIKIIIQKIQEINNSMVIWSPCLEDSEIRKDYQQLSDAEYRERRKEEPTLCQKFALDIQQALTELGFEVRYLFAYLEPMLVDRVRGFGLNYRLAKAVAENKYKKATRLCLKTITGFPARDSIERSTHALLEIKIKDRFLVISPMAGLLYRATKEELLAGRGIWESWHFKNQVKYLLNNIHKNKRSLLFATPIAWSKVYHLTNDSQGDLPETLPALKTNYPNPYLCL